ncbi:MAG: GNAT family N-acetyltransferase [Myxococcales bacterium]|nr:GNAT family N-acetyltransferase [Myxococcales bacterium]MCB9671944.1 GNAT family N-acetyltransferase [Alphaproteobacteria bacterium]
MESYDADGDPRRSPPITVVEVSEPDVSVIRTLVDVDLATFSESSFSDFALASLVRNGRVFLLQHGTSTIGTCITMRCWERPSEAMVLSMGIKPGWRGQGLGQTFLVAVLARLRQRGLRSACLYVGADNRRALQLYQDCGFETVEIGSDLQGSTMVLMRAQLGEPELISLD